jgi:hypothetical protein
MKLSWTRTSLASVGIGAQRPVKAGQPACG